MHILLTNDDGVFSPGLAALINELKKIAKITVVAPDRERSATGHSLTFFYPLRVHKIKESKNLCIFASDGTPTDCILLGIHDVLEQRPDLVISGINRGGNLGDDITYSGTVSAALEGVIQGVPAFAISVAAFENVYYDYAAAFARKLALNIIKHGLPPRTILNVNVPNLPPEEIKGHCITCQGDTTYEQRVLKRMDPRGVEYYWIAGSIPTGEPQPLTDFKAIAEHKISITPLHLDMTNFKAFKELEGWKL
jgi:5'-nucleotidase